MLLPSFDSLRLERPRDVIRGARLAEELGYLAVGLRDVILMPLGAEPLVQYERFAAVRELLSRWVSREARERSDP